MNKIITHLKDNWIRHGFETLVVVMSILLAFSLNSWNESLKDKRQEFQVLQQFEKDFETNRYLIEKGMISYRYSLKRQNLALRITGPKASKPTKQEFDTLVLLNYPTLSLVPGSLNNTAQSSLLRDDALVSMLTAFPSSFALYKEGEDRVRELTLKRRFIHEKYINLLDRVSEFDDVNLIRFPSDTIGWLRDRDYHILSVVQKWMVEEAMVELLAVQENNDLILEIISGELDRF